MQNQAESAGVKLGHLLWLTSWATNGFGAGAHGCFISEIGYGYRYIEIGYINIFECSCFGCVLIKTYAETNWFLGPYSLSVYDNVTMMCDYMHRENSENSENSEHWVH